ncbi:efflux RND transporter periplasmic adaptor subunit [Zunongwangia sp. H14]|uniref:efflux RND transporter periplasmic adaptor subunit n=1 Tax=Zunongwangia sp. H14 TaxID=3240792 RepID=UPI0035698D32
MKRIDNKTGYIAIGFLLAGLILGWLFFGGSSGTETTLEANSNEELHSHEGEGEVWTCAMHSQIREDGPGQCPICGMELIPVASGGQMVGEGEIQMTEAAMKIADIETFRVQESSPIKEVYLPGKVKADERLVSNVTSRFPGRIEKLYVNFTGQQVKRGERLASIYSPELVQAQKELLEAVSFRETNPSFYEAAINKLKLWNLTDGQIANIEKNGKVQYNFDIYSTQSGTVISRNVSEGDYLSEGQALLDIANLKKVWVLFDAYESDLPWIKKGDKVEFSAASMPGQTFTSTVTFIDPVINPQTRVALVRTEVDNPGGSLKPDMFVQGILTSKLKVLENSLVVPKSSILWTGKNAVVYVKDQSRDEPTFEYREVVLGPEAGDQYVILGGLNAGEEVVVNGVFKVDAAAQLGGKRSMMNAEGGKVNTGHNHGDMDSPDALMEMEKNTGMPQSQVDHSKMEKRNEVAKEFKDQLNQAFKIYLNLKDAFAQDNATNAANSARDLYQSVSQIDMKLLNSPEAHSHWMTIEKEISASANSISKTSELKAQRKHFKHLSAHFSKAVKLFGVNKKVYEQFCPMADDNKGATWLSLSEEIQNPYMGQAMSTCGEIRDTIE